MSYCRSLETGHYIWPAENGVCFDGICIPDETIDIFLAKLYYNHSNEFKERLANGKNIIENAKYNLDE